MQHIVLRRFASPVQCCPRPHIAVANNHTSKLFHVLLPSSLDQTIQRYSVTTDSLTSDSSRCRCFAMPSGTNGQQRSTLPPTAAYGTEDHNTDPRFVPPLKSATLRSDADVVREAAMPLPDNVERNDRRTWDSEALTRNSYLPMHIASTLRSRTKLTIACTWPRCMRPHRDEGSCHVTVHHTLGSGTFRRDAVTQPHGFAYHLASAQPRVAADCHTGTSNA